MMIYKTITVCLCYEMDKSGSSMEMEYFDSWENIIKTKSRGIVAKGVKSYAEGKLELGDFTA